jgi:hypothetical protein
MFRSASAEKEHQQSKTKCNILLREGKHYRLVDIVICIVPVALLAVRRQMEEACRRSIRLKFLCSVSSIHQQLAIVHHYTLTCRESTIHQICVDLEEDETRRCEYR